MRGVTRLYHASIALGGTMLLALPAVAQLSQQGGKLSGTGGIGAAQQGYSVAISADGSTTLIGGPADSSNTGAAWVFTQNAGVWMQQGGKLVGTGAVGAAFQGNSVAISADGNTAIVGGPNDDSNAGAAWVFTRSAGVWSQQGSKLVGTGAVGAAQQGTSVAISADGNTAVVGGWADHSGIGAAWVFARSGDVWSQQGGKLVGSGAIGDSNLGWSVAISGDATTAIVGGPFDASGVGAAWVFTRSGGVWSQQGSKLVGVGSSGTPFEANAVAISADGNTAVLAGPGDNLSVGAVWVFTRSGSTWSQQGSKLVGANAVGVAAQGIGLALSADGNTAVVGGTADSSNTGATWVFTRTGSLWSQQGGKLVGSGAVGDAQQGDSVAVSGDGSIAIVGGYLDDTWAGGSAGATWVFTRSEETWSQQGDKLVGTGAAGASKQGSAVAVAADGNTAIIGGPGDGGGVGAVWIFTRSSGVWSQQGERLIGTGAVGSSQQGAAVAVSSDGNTAIVGGPGGDGGAWVFTRTAGVWSQQGDRLLGDAATGTMQGTSVAISSDGNTAIVGGPWDGSGAGAAWVFTRTAGVWSQQGDKLVGTGAVGNARMGSSVAISGDGTTAIIGGPLDSSSAGAVWIFTRTGDVWSQQGTKLVGTGADGGTLGLVNQGWSVAISVDGNTALSGAWGDDGNGAVWVFTRTGEVWSQQGDKLVGTGASGNAQQGQSVAISADGNTAVVGGWLDDSSAGATWVFTRSGDVWFQLSDKLIGTGATGTARQGTAVAISSNGSTVVAGGPTDNGDAGAAWVFASSVCMAGDVNGDGAVNVTDVFYLINYLFAGGPSPTGCADVNGDSVLNVTDVFYLINYLFAGGPAPV